MTRSPIGGRYALERELGRGAGGAVWCGHDQLLDRQVALKPLGRHPEGSGVAIRAGREARLAARVSHPHVVSVFDLVQDADELWLVMEYVDGQALSAILATDGAMAPDDAAELLAPVADALREAHEHGIVHRDVKPSNILLSGDGVAKLSDFGIARGDDDATLTQAGMVTGSPAYLAPEVALGTPASPASDVWSLGATLVHVLTGRTPYHQEGLENGPLAVVYRVVHSAPPRPAQAGWLSPLVAAMMAADPTARPSMAEVRDRLRRGASPEAEQTATLPTASTPVRHRPRRAGVLVAGVVLVGVAAVAFALILATLLVDGDDAPQRRATASTSSATPPPTADEPPSAAELEEFARGYVRTAHQDPAAGFAMLTADYQQQSPDYADFWGAVRRPEILDVTADPAAMRVTYRYRYTLPGAGRRTEQVTLDLERHRNNLLIAGARSVTSDR